MLLMKCAESLGTGIGDMEELKPMKCPVCGLTTFAYSNDFDICPVCGWENDGVQLLKPDFEGGANTISLNQARKHWQALLRIAKKVNPNIEIGQKIWDESEHYLIQNICEEVNLFSKTENKVVCIGDHYGDAEGSFIDKNENWACSYGEGLTVYYLKEPFKSYDRGECNEQWFNCGQETNSKDVTYIENVMQLDDWKILVVEADTLKKYEIDIPHGGYH